MSSASRSPILLIVTILVVCSGWRVATKLWRSEEHPTYTLFYQQADKKNKKQYRHFFDKGIIATQEFFGGTYKAKFAIYLHPNRQSLDSQWRIDWKMPDFRSECWMVASGVSNKLDIISPITWDKGSCEHSYKDKQKTQRLVTHELVHVFHGQQNASPDFSDTENIDWFVEGLATYASGQLDSSAIHTIQTLIRNNQVPASLDEFWKGTSRYGLSGSVVLYIDRVYGREKLKSLLPFNKKAAILTALNSSEEQLIAGWKKYLLQ